MQQSYRRTPIRNGCSPVNLLHIFRIPFPKNSSGRLLLQVTWGSLTEMPFTIVIFGSTSRIWEFTSFMVNCINVICEPEYSLGIMCLNTCTYREFVHRTTKHFLLLVKILIKPLCDVLIFLVIPLLWSA